MANFIVGTFEFPAPPVSSALSWLEMFEINAKTSSPIRQNEEES